jgi:hypothetical protein
MVETDDWQSISKPVSVEICALFEAIRFGLSNRIEGLCIVIPAKAGSQ